MIPTSGCHLFGEFLVIQLSGWHLQSWLYGKAHAMRNEVTGERQREKEVSFRDHTMWLPEQRDQGNME